MGPPLISTAERAQGYSLALVATLDKPETLPIYTDHPEHVKYVGLPVEESNHCKLTMRSK